MEAADLANAVDLFGVGSNEPPVIVTTESPLEASPSSRPEFDEYLKHLSAKISTFEGSAHYSYFVESLVRCAVASMSLDDTRKVSSSLTAMISEKQKAQSNSKKKKKGVSLKMAKGGDSTYGGEDLYSGQYDDFM